MATLDRPSNAVSALRARPEGGARFDLSVALLALWFVIGLFVDGWAHNHGAVDNTFFTPYHALLYSGILASGLFLGIHQYRNIGKGYAFMRALPYGYNLSLVGVALFFVGGGFDFVWHSLFGFEANISALLSPSHLLLATAGLLILSGPLRAAWQWTKVRPTWGNMLPVVLSLLMILSVMTFFMQFSNGFSHAWNFTPGAQGQANDSWKMDVIGISDVLFPTALTMGVLLFALRRWTLPFGAVTLIVTINAAGMMLIQWHDMRDFWFLIFAPLLAGLVGDGLLRTLKRKNPLTLRAFGFTVPFVLFLVYFLLLITRTGIWWEVHKWLGVTFMAGAIGVFLSYLALPPALPEEA